MSTGTRSDAIRCTRRTRSEIGTRPTTAASDAMVRPTGPETTARSATSATRDAPQTRRGSAVDERDATQRAVRTARGAATAVARTVPRIRTASDAGTRSGSVQDPTSGSSQSTATAAPLRERWIMYRTATLRSAVELDTAPRTTMNCDGPVDLRTRREAKVAAAPPLRPGSQETLAPASVPRIEERTSVRLIARRGSSRCSGIEPGLALNPMSKLGIPKRPENNGNRITPASSGVGPRNVATPRAPASAWTHAARQTRRAFPLRDSDTSNAARTKARNTDR